MNKPSSNVLELPLLERATLALRAAVRKTIEEHARDGASVSIWRDGKVVVVPAKELLQDS